MSAMKAAVAPHSAVGVEACIAGHANTGRPAFPEIPITLRDTALVETFVIAMGKRSPEF
jgi:hypothetical protein